MLLAAGLSSRVAAELLPCTITGRADTTVLARPAGERAALQQHIDHLVATIARLDEVIAAAQRCTHDGSASNGPLPPV